jgi:hypothetical protein
MKNFIDSNIEEYPVFRLSRAVQSSSLGSLAAVATWIAAGNATAAPQLSTTTVNFSLTNGAQFDINGDGRMDFNISDNFNNHQELVLAGLNGSLSARSGTYGQYNYYSQVLSEGSPVNNTLTYTNLTDLSRTGNTASPAYLGTFSTGVKFYDINNALHYSWITFSFPGNTYPWIGAKAVSAGWETTPNTAILVGAVPESSVSMLGSMALVVLLAGRFLKRKLGKV